MRDDQDRPFVVDQVLLEPGDRLGVEVVGRFVEEQHVGRFKEQFAKRDAARLTTGQRRDIGIIRGAAQRLHCDVDLAVEIPEVFTVDLVLKLRHLFGSFVRVVHGKFVKAVELFLFRSHAEHDVFADVQAFDELRFLGQVADADALGRPSFTRKVAVYARHDPHQGRFTGTVRADHADFHTRQKAETNVFEQLFATRIGF